MFKFKDMKIPYQLFKNYKFKCQLHNKTTQPKCASNLHHIAPKKGKSGIDYVLKRSTKWNYNVEILFETR